MLLRILCALSLSLTAKLAHAHEVETVLTVYHRVGSFSTHASRPAAGRSDRWTERGQFTIDWDSNTASYAATARSIDWDDLEKSLTRSVRDSDGDGARTEGPRAPRYEIKVGGRSELADGDDETGWATVDPCRLFSTSPSTFSERFTLHFAPSSPVVTDDAGPRRFVGFDYSTTSAGSELACGTEGPFKRDGLELGFKSRHDVSATIVDPVVLETPTLAVPLETEARVQVDKDGKVVAPPPPKSFLQKYWMYILPAVVFVLIGGGSEEGKK
ncbi:hypothetical protein JCM10212_004638 [Sporobolomyces blumeae]